MSRSKTEYLKYELEGGKKVVEETKKVMTISGNMEGEIKNYEIKIMEVLMKM